MEDLREKQLSVLLMDLRDTKEELEQLTKKVTKEDTLDTCGSWMSEEVDHVTDRTVSQAEDTANTYLLQKGTVQEISLTATEEQSSLMHETTIHVTEHWSESHLETTTQVTQTKNMDLKTNDQILSLKQQVSELQVQLEALGIEKDSLAVKLHAMLQEHKITESLQRTDRELTDTEKKMTMYESQNMLAEQVSSLENESRSKDLKIMVLQEDLDKLNALLSDNQTRLKEKESDLKNITESLNQSQSKERQLSEAFAASESVLVSVQNLISDKTKEIESLQSCLAEKDEQVAEISHSLSDKIVHLNEEKHSMKKEINNLKEKLRSATQGKNLELEQSIQRKERKSELQNMLELTQRVEEEMQLEGVQSQNSENKGSVSHKIEQQTQENLQHQEMLQNVVREQNDLLVPLPSVCHEHLQQVELVKRLQTAQEEQKILTDNEDVGSVQDQLKHCRTENEQLKKKLQVALANRKELLKKVSVLEKEQEKTNASLLATKDFLFNENDESIPQKVLEKNITEVFLKQQLLERDAELEAVKQELMQNKLSVERLEILVKEMTHELAEKSNLSGHVNTAQMENLCVIKTSESQNLTSDLIHSSDHENNRLKLESIILNLEQDKENLQKKVQEALNSRRDTIKKAQEKDRHHREQLKQHKEEFNLLQEKCEELQRSQKVLIGQCCQEKGTQTIDLYPAGRPQNSEAEEPASVVLSTKISPIEQNVQDSNWGNDWTELSNIEDKDAINHNSSQGAEMLEDYRTQLKYLQTQKTELEFRTVCLERDLAGRLEEILNLQETVVNVTGSLKNEREKCQESDIQAATMKAALEDQLQELELETKNMREMLNLKNDEIKNLRLMLEERNTILEGLKISVQEKEELITSLKCQLECQVKELALSSHKLEMQQNKQDDDAQEAKSKQQLQRKLQAALISRKELLNEIKTLKSELGTTHKYKEELNNRLQAAETSINHLNEEKHQMLENFSKQKDERYKLIEEVDKRLLEIQSLETSCESLKLALEGITQEKAILENELKSIKDEHVSETSEYKEKISEMKKEYETLLQSYENVSNETDRMKRAMETVRQEKQEILNKLTAVESAKADLVKQIEETEAEIENMKEKMRKFAKSKQQKILELEEENEKLRGDMEPYDKQRQLLNTTKAENAELRTKVETLRSEKQALAAQIESLHLEKVTETDVISSQLQSIEATFQDVLEEDVPGSQDNLNDLCPPSTNTEEPEGNDLVPQVLDQDKQTQEDPKESVRDFMNETETLKTQLLALKDEKNKTELKLAAVLDERGNMQKRVSDLETNCEKIKKEVDEVIKQKEIVEFEKDELEERLMNQLAELNGSIGNYQQDAVEHQMRNESLQRQLRDLQLQLEEEKRQLERQRAEAMSQVQKDYVEKLKSVYEGEKGKKTQAKKLHELLKEKQQEIWHLQKDCINYQETISGLERVNKALVFKQSESEKEMATANERIAKAMNATEQARAELASLHVQLDDTQSEAARVLAENMKLKEDVQALRENIVSALKRKEDDLEKRLEQERDKHVKDVGNMQEQVNFLLLEKKRLEASIKDLQLTLDTKTKEIKDLEGNLTQNLAKLAAFSRSMCSLQDDRDRVIEESRKWDLKFTEAMHKKDKELTEKEKTLEAAKNELSEITKQMEALHTQVSR
ncbi:golgin subfamily B member 1 [Bombina bombina]|uniref:golgin subfamily B member 1 n=1 Tax=Bombina bombina TaxID=8345 RepID=UPI00235ADB95|nr:golgin subfamily B member 1 [Bombina bombina]